MAAVLRPLDRVHTEFILDSWIRPKPQQGLNKTPIVLLNSVVQRRASHFANGINVRTMLYQYFCAFNVSLKSNSVQQSVTVNCTGIDFQRVPINEKRITGISGENVF